MTHSEFYLLLAEIIDEPPGSVTGESVLGDFPGWDSLAVLSFIAMADERFNLEVAGNSVTANVTANDLADLLGPNITS